MEVVPTQRCSQEDDAAAMGAEDDDESGRFVVHDRYGGASQALTRPPSHLWRCSRRRRRERGEPPQWQCMQGQAVVPEGANQDSLESIDDANLWAGLEDSWRLLSQFWGAEVRQNMVFQQ